MRRAVAVPKRYLIYTLAVVAVAGAIGFLTWKSVPLRGSQALIVLVLAAILAESLAIRLPTGATISLAFPLTVAAMLTLGPSGAMLVAVASAVGPRDLRAGRSPVIALFNVGQIALVSVAAAWTYRLVADGLDARMPLGFAVAVAVLACVVVATVGNDALVGFGIHLKSGTPLSDIWHLGIGWMIPTQLALALVGALMAWSVNVSAWTLPLFAVPLLIAQSVFSRSAEYEVALRDTVRALVGLIEAKDRYTAGHSERVAHYARRIGEAVRLNRNQLDKLELAALLHDLGKVGVPTTLLNSRGALTADEIAEIRRHPAIGAGFVVGIPGLRDLGETIAHHHERYDGDGYGEGLKADRIPLDARILAVADSYDAMTSDRPYRSKLTAEAALSEIADQSGRQFDPRVAGAFLALGLEMDDVG